MKREAEGRRSGQTLHEEIELRPAGGVRGHELAVQDGRVPANGVDGGARTRETPEGVAAAGYQAAGARRSCLIGFANRISNLGKFHGKCDELVF